MWVAVLAFGLAVRLVYLVLVRPKQTLTLGSLFNGHSNGRRKRRRKVWVILGSGGHTTEALSLTRPLWDDQSPLKETDIDWTFVSSDPLSLSKVPSDVVCVKLSIPRARHGMQRRE